VLWFLPALGAAVLTAPCAAIRLEPWPGLGAEAGPKDARRPASTMQGGCLPRAT
jgi:hypothetical protein